MHFIVLLLSEKSSIYGLKDVSIITNNYWHVILGIYTTINAWKSILLLLVYCINSVVCLYMLLF